jgi:dephospho-CoA kinase
MTRIALTGGIAGGKSLVGAFLVENGVPVSDADEIAHSLMRPGEDVFRSVVAAFGSGILGEDGRIDRRCLGRRVFADRAQLERLNAIVHPAVRTEWEAWLDTREKGGSSVAAVIVPLLYEAGAGSGWDAVVCVTASASVRLCRMTTRGLSVEEARARMDAQSPEHEKSRLADYVIINNGDEQLLREQTVRTLCSIMER